MDFEVKRLHARINALEIALVAALKSDAETLSVVRQALDTAHDQAVKHRDAPVPNGFQKTVGSEPRAHTDTEAEDLRVTTLDALRKKLG